MDRGIRLKLPVHRFFLTATNNRKEISTLCRLVEKSLVRGNRCIRSGIYNSLSLSHSSPFPFFRKMHSPREKSDGLIVGKFLSILFPSLTLYSSTIFNKIWWIDRFAFVIHLFLFPNSIMEIEIHLANDYLLTFNSINCAFLRIFFHSSLFFFILHARRLFL